MSTFYSDQQLLANQFCEGSNFAIWLREKMRSYDNAADWVEYLEANLDIYTARGFWLDLFGLIIGQPRTIDSVVPKDFFGFVGAPAVKGFSDTARFWDGVESKTSGTVLADPEYRVILLAKIAFNYSNVTLIGVTESLSIIFDTADITISNNGGGDFDIFVNKVLTPVEVAIATTLRLIPVAAGINYNLTSA
jgi:hypothetical protein